MRYNELLSGAFGRDELVGLIGSAVWSNLLSLRGEQGFQSGLFSSKLARFVFCPEISSG